MVTASDGFIPDWNELPPALQVFLVAVLLASAVGPIIVGIGLFAVGRAERRRRNAPRHSLDDVDAESSDG